ncbi:TPA: hypothetical protein PEE30_002649 [Staphylococcus aureus]|uniref:phage tail tip lysozyme n=2 Tax=Staphylococcus chromogenes TaxID=46126 RepID=UPI001890506A|nr:phage tail tip lysozyme [Staphylococcus chromogenes]HDF3152068.1 hypothetical protein [Staphylococcus aureus]
MKQHIKSDLSFFMKVFIVFVFLIVTTFPHVTKSNTTEAVNSTIIDAQRGCYVESNGDDEKKDGDGDEGDSESSEGSTGGVGELTDKKKRNIKTMYKVLHEEHGFSGQMIAGIAGNWDIEGGIDPMATEGDSGNFSEANAKKASGESNRGIGLGQWTFERHTQLVEYGEKKNNGKWWTMEIQLEFMIEADSGAEALKEVGKNSTDDPGENALSFHDEWERSADTSEAKQRRISSAKTIWKYMQSEGMNGKKDVSKIEGVGGSSSSKDEGESSASTKGDVKETEVCGNEEDEQGEEDNSGKVGASTKINGKSGRVTEGSWTWEDLPEKYKKHVTIPKFRKEFLNKPGNVFVNTGNTGQCTELTWAYMNQLYGEGQPTDDGQTTDGFRVHEVYKKKGAKVTHKPTVGYAFSSSSPYGGAAATPPGHTGLVAGVMDDGGFILVSFNLPPKPAPSRVPIYSYVDGMPKDAGDDFIFFSGINGGKKAKDADKKD